MIQAIHIVLVIEILTLLAVLFLIFYFDDALKRFSKFCWNEAYTPFEDENSTSTTKNYSITFPD